MPESLSMVITALLIVMIIAANVMVWLALRKLKQAINAHTAAREEYVESMKEITAMLQDMEDRKPKPKTDFDARGGDWL